MLYRFFMAYDKPETNPDDEEEITLTSSHLEKKDVQKGKSSMTRNDSEFSLGMTRSGSLADIVNLSRGVDSLGEFCSGGKVAFEVLKFIGSGVVVCGVCWKLLDMTATQKRSS